MRVLNAPPSRFLVLCRDTDGHIHAITTSGNTWFIADQADLDQCLLTARHARAVMRFIDKADSGFWIHQRGNLHNGVAGLTSLVRNSVFVRRVATAYVPVPFHFTKRVTSKSPKVPRRIKKSQPSGWYLPGP